MTDTKDNRVYRAAGYCRLSREDGDKPESDSITNQQRILEDFCARHLDLELTATYTDDGYTGTNFDRPGFRAMLEDVKAGKIDCIVVKDLSRFGRDYIEMGFYLERVFPSLGVRFIAIGDNVDSLSGPYDMMLPLKNVFNAQYAKDISQKVRSSFRSKQSRGQFVGAFAGYGYCKDPEDRNHLVIDPVAAEVVRRIFTMAASGMGQVRIAKTLNEEGVPCPSLYKKQMGLRYNNRRRLDSTTYWTYATVHRLLHNRMYLGDMVQGVYVRPTMHGKVKKMDKSQWTVVEGTHEAIVSRELWDAVQAQADKNSRPVDFQGNIGLLAGFLKCGDCGRSMVKTSFQGRITYCCGSYRRYGAAVCSAHYIPQEDIEAVLLGDLNRIIAQVQDLRRLAEQNKAPDRRKDSRAHEQQRLQAALERVQRLKKNVYEDYRERLLSKEDFLKYREDYDQQEASLTRQLRRFQEEAEEENTARPWVDKLLELGHLEQLDRMTVAQTVQEIRIFEDRRIEITYLFSRALGDLLDDDTPKM